MEAIQLTDMTYVFLTGLPRADEDAVCTTCGGTADRRYDGDVFCEPCVVQTVCVWITTCPTCDAGPDQPCVMDDGGYDLGRIHIARERVWDNRRGCAPPAGRQRASPVSGPAAASASTSMPPAGNPIWCSRTRRARTNSSCFRQRHPTTGKWREHQAQVKAGEAVPGGGRHCGPASGRS